MTPENFCYWLQGLFELSDVDANKKNVNHTLSIEQVKSIKEHLGYVFAKPTPPTWPSSGQLISDPKLQVGASIC